MTSRRTVHALLAALLVLAFALAGCAGRGGDDPTPTTSPTPTGPGPAPTTPGPTPGAPPRAPITEFPLLLGFGLLDCTGVRVLQPTDPAVVDALLPDGFTAARTALLPGAVEGAFLGADLYHCGAFSTQVGTFEGQWFGRLFAPVQEPAERYPERDITADVHVYLFELLADDEDILAALWPAAGYPTHNGTAVLSPASLALVALVSGGVGDYTFTVQGAALPDDGSASFRWYHVLAGGDTLLWSGNETFAATHDGTGSAGVAGSPFEGHGTPSGNTLRGQGIYGSADFTDSTLVRLLATPL